MKVSHYFKNHYMDNIHKPLKRIFSSAFVMIFLTVITNAQDSTHLSEKQEKCLSKKTIKTNVLGQSTFNSFARYLYAINIASIETDNPEVSIKHLRSLPDANRSITIRELFDEIANQTSSTWSFDEKRNCYIFSKPLPFVFELARGWTKEIRNGYIFLKPPKAPAGLDIYFAGQIGSLETINDARIRIAKQYAEPITPGVTEASMQEDTFSSQKVLFYKTVIQSNKTIWRQWAIVANEQCFVLVSAIKPEDETIIFPDVEKMIQSFKVIGIENNK